MDPLWRLVYGTKECMVLAAFGWVMWAVGPRFSFFTRDHPWQRFFLYVLPVFTTIHLDYVVTFAPNMDVNFDANAFNGTGECAVSV